MKREEKTALIEALQERLQGASLAIMTQYRGLTVAQMNQLRRELKQVNATYQVTKNTLTRRALKDTAFAKLEELLQGPTGLVTAVTDPVAAAKVLVRFAEQHDKLKITGGVLDGAVLPAKEVGALAKLPSREVLLAQFLGLLQAPATQLVRTIQEPGAMVARLIGVLERSKRDASGPSTEQETGDAAGPSTEQETEGGAVS